MQPYSLLRILNKCMNDDGTYDVTDHALRKCKDTLTTDYTFIMLTICYNFCCYCI